MWAAMMVAMMAPTLAPVTLAHQAALRERGGGPAPTAAFVTGFLVVWAATGLVAWPPYRLILELPASAAHSRWLPTLAGALLVAIGAYQFSPWKTHCLRMCRRPVASVGGVDVSGTVPSAFRAGTLHGVHCLGCCWALMVILLVVGVMNLWWMAVIAFVFLVDKHWKYGEGFSRAAGIGLVLLGGAVIVAPDVLPWIAGVDIHGPIDMTDMGGM
jgi:predicted metal-binding membrane protein